MIKTCLPLQRDVRDLLAQPHWAARVEPDPSAAFLHSSKRRFTGKDARLGAIPPVAATKRRW